MFICYTDASVKNNQAYLAFVIVFEDTSYVRRKIVVEERDNNMAEALAVLELLSFLKYYNFKKGLILLDANVVKKQLRNKGRKIHKFIPKGTKEILNDLQIRTQIIPRKYNIAHKVCSTNKFAKSKPLSRVNRLPRENKKPDYFLQLSVLEEYRELYNQRYVTFHETQKRINKEIGLADLVEEVEGSRTYKIHNKKIIVKEDTIVKIYSVIS
ncbi:hypothetical protein U8V72_25825 [Priestia filamentosa]|uniref:hypothetical protein n=1 Tax=Priestia filamentosa TaxID=1402861 RepID=UPI00397C49AC